MTKFEFVAVISPFSATDKAKGKTLTFDLTLTWFVTIKETWKFSKRVIVERLPLPAAGSGVLI